MRNGLGEHERAFGSSVFVVAGVVVDGAEVDTRASFQGREESGGHVGTEPIGGAIQLLTRYEATIVGHFQDWQGVGIQYVLRRGKMEEIWFERLVMRDEMKRGKFPLPIW